MRRTGCFTMPSGKERLENEVDSCASSRGGPQRLSYCNDVEGAMPSAKERKLSHVKGYNCKVIIVWLHSLTRFYRFYRFYRFNYKLNALELSIAYPSIDSQRRKAPMVPEACAK